MASLLELTVEQHSPGCSGLRRGLLKCRAGVSVQGSVQSVVRAFLYYSRRFSRVHSVLK